MIRVNEKSDSGDCSPRPIPMKPFLSHVSVAAAGALLGGSLHAQELIPGTYNPWTASGSAQPAARPVDLLGEIFIGPANGTNTVGPWSLSATGLSQIQLIGGTLNIGTRAQTEVNASNQSLSFQLDSFANVGVLNLDDLLGAGVAMSWQADLTFANFDWDVAPTYQLDFDLTAPGGLLANLLDLDTSLSVSVLDGNGNLVHSANGSALIGLLGVNLGDPLTNEGVSLVFSGAAAEADGLTVRFSSAKTVTTSLLDIGSTVATFSGVSFTAVPEPRIPVFAGLAALALAARRRRGRV